jgi:hypothetical protein
VKNPSTTAKVGAVVLLVAAAAACGGDDQAREAAAAPTVDLVISVTTPQGDRETRLECDAAARSRACEAARRLADFLAQQPPRGRVCTQIYGGPETARVRGTIDERRVDRRFSKTNGCEIADWERAEPLLEGTG